MSQFLSQADSILPIQLASHSKGFAKAVDYMSQHFSQGNYVVLFQHRLAQGAHERHSLNVCVRRPPRAGDAITFDGFLIRQEVLRIIPEHS